MNQNLKITNINTYSLPDSKRLIAEFYNTENYLILKIDVDSDIDKEEFYQIVSNIVKANNPNYYSKLLIDYNIQSEQLKELLKYKIEYNL